MAKEEIRPNAPVQTFFFGGMKNSLGAFGNLRKMPHGAD